MEGDGTYKLRYDTPEGSRTVRSRSVALTVPAYVAAGLVEGESPAAASLLKEIDYPPVAAVSLAYPKTSILQSRLDNGGDLPGQPALPPPLQTPILTLAVVSLADPNTSILQNRLEYKADLPGLISPHTHCSTSHPLPKRLIIRGA